MSDDLTEGLERAVQHLLENMAEQKLATEKVTELRSTLTQELMGEADPLRRDNLREYIAVLREAEDRTHARDLASTEWVLATGALRLSHKANQHNETLVRATWVLSAATIVLAIATVALIFVTAGL